MTNKEYIFIFYIYRLVIFIILLKAAKIKNLKHGSFQENVACYFSESISGPTLRDDLKELYAEFHVTLTANMPMSDSQGFRLNLYLIKNVKDIVVFCSINAQATFVVKPQLKIVS